MNRYELNNFLKEIGVHAEHLTTEAYKKVDAYKSKLDTDTRRKVRAWWLVVSALAFVAGFFVGRIFA